MQYAQTKSIIDSARDVLVGKLPAPNTQVEQITLAMLYKFMDDIDHEAYSLGAEVKYFAGEFKKYSWKEIMKKSVSAQNRMNLYIEALVKFYNHPNIPHTFREIFKNATVPYRDPEVLTMFLKYIDQITYSNSEVLGDAYEYLLSILGSQGELGQFRTPRHIIDFIVQVVDPKKDNTVLDPACGTGGFLISVYKYIANENKSMSFDEKNRILDNLIGYDIEPSMVRIADMNMYLHGCTSPNINEYDTLTQEDRWNDKYDIILANPPFFTPKGGITPHSKFALKSKKAEVLFSEYIIDHVKRHGRGAFIVPEGIVANNNNEYNIKLRKKMLDNGLYAVVGLHEYVFKPYAGVSTNIIFFDKKYRDNNKLYLNVIEEDGFVKGESRLPTPEINEIPSILEDLRQFKQYIEGQKESITTTGKILSINELDDSLDFHPYSYYENEIPPTKTVDEVFNIEKGSLQSTKSIDGEYVFVTASDDWSTHVTYTHDTEALIFVHGAGGSLAKVHYINGKFIASDLCYIMTPKEGMDIDIRYYYAYFSANRVDIRKRLARGTNKKSINQTRLKNYLIKFPQKSEQKLIGEKVQEKFDNIDKLKKEIQNELSSIDSLF